MLNKNTTNNSGTLTFTWSGRSSAIACITRNKENSSLYYIGVNYDNTVTAIKLGGADVDITSDASKKAINFSVPDWSNVTFIVGAGSFK